MKRFLVFIGLVFAVTITAQISETPIKSNLIINGDFRIPQRGTSFASPATLSYTLDRWRYVYYGSMRHTISQDTDVPTLAQAGITTQYSLKVDCTTSTSISADNFAVVDQPIEGYNIAPYVGRNLTLSFWVKSTKTGTFCVRASNSSLDRVYLAEYTISSSNTWEKKTITIPMNYSGGTWNYADGIGMLLQFIIACGSNYLGTADTWNTNGAIATSSQVNACDSTDNNFWLANVKLEPGSVPTKYEPRMYADELRLCQRYTVKLTSGNACSIFGQGIAYSTTQAGTYCNLPTVLRAVPTAVTYSGSFRFARGTSVYAVTSITLFSNGSTTSMGGLIVDVAPGLTDGVFYRLDANNDANAYLIFTAEL